MKASSLGEPSLKLSSGSSSGSRFILSLGHSLSNKLEPIDGGPRTIAERNEHCSALC